MPIRAISLDVHGTLILPHPSVGAIYAAVAQEHGLEGQVGARRRGEIGVLLRNADSAMFHAKTAGVEKTFRWGLDRFIKKAQTLARRWWRSAPNIQCRCTSAKSRGPRLLISIASANPRRRSASSSPSNAARGAQRAGASLGVTPA